MESLNTRLEAALSEVNQLKSLLVAKDKEILALQDRVTELECRNESKISEKTVESCSATNDEIKQKTKLTNPEISRYSRQLILPELGVTGQLNISRSSVLVVGCGGLGCPVAVYLAATGVGRLGLVDYDTVEISNLHRQVMHSEAKVGFKKCDSLAEQCLRLNSSIKVEPHYTLLNSINALQLIDKYDIVVDATDNVATRYLLSDSCVLLNKPLVSGSALRFEGQVTVYNYKNSACYRCLFPKPPSPDMVTNCSDGGVVGPVVGVIGCLQAMEVIKIASNMDSADSLAGRMLIYDGLSCMVRIVKLRGKKEECPACGKNPTINRLIDYEQFCGASASDKDGGLNILTRDERISVEDYKHDIDEGVRHILIDVRQPVELEICKLSSTSHNIPIDRFKIKNELERMAEIIRENSPQNVYMVCRRGNDSQLAVTSLKRHLNDTGVTNVVVKDIIGGLHAWARNIDNDFPVY